MLKLFNSFFFIILYLYSINLFSQTNQTENLNKTNIIIYKSNSLDLSFNFYGIPIHRNNKTINIEEDTINNILKVYNNHYQLKYEFKIKHIDSIYIKYYYNSGQIKKTENWEVYFKDTCNNFIAFSDGFMQLGKWQFYNRKNILYKEAEYKIEVESCSPFIYRLIRYSKNYIINISTKKIIEKRLQ